MKTLVKIAKKCVLVLLILSMEVPCNACFFPVNTEHVASHGKGNVPTGLYVMYEMTDACSSVMQKLSEMDENLQLPSDDVNDYNRKISGVAVKEMISACAKEKVMMHLAVDALFDELKLTLPAESKKQLEDYSRMYGVNKKDLAENGIGKESVVAYFENKMKYEQLYNYYYGDKGVNKLTDKELRDLFERSYVKLQIEKFYYSESLAGDDKKAQVSAVNFYKDVRSLGFAEALLKKEDEQKAKQKAEEEERKKKKEEEERKKAKEEAEKKEKAAKEKTDGKTAETADKAGAKSDGKTEDKPENKPVAGPEKFGGNVISNEFQAPAEPQKEESREERLKRLNGMSVSLMSEKQMRGAYKEDERKLIGKYPVGEPAVFNFPRENAFVVVMSLQKDEEDFLAKKEEIAHDVGVKKFEAMLLARAQKLGAKFDGRVVTKFGIDKLKTREREKE
ncbi:MAG: hypothetical protein LBB04_02925 [Oscillospiraceae bacterium]|jgi:hypothetical protein|nr:hypothetical protein [Oscillospiraceae bacterium]